MHVIFLQSKKREELGTRTALSLPSFFRQVPRACSLRVNSAVILQHRATAAVKRTAWEEVTTAALLKAALYIACNFAIFHPSSFPSVTRLW